MTEQIRIGGLREFQKALKEMDAGLPRQLRVALNEAADLVVGYAAPRMPSRSGRARSSLKSRSTQRVARIAMGGRKAPYAPWLDFGGEGRRKGRPAPRPFIKAGRYIYPGLAANRDEITEKMSDALTDLARTAGLVVT